MKRVAFDLGNVIVKVDWKIFFDEWSRYISTDVREFMRNIQYQQDVGLINMDKALSGITGNDTIKKLKVAWGSVITLSDDIFSLLEDYKERNYSVAILSNIGSDHADIMRKVYPTIFDGAILHLSYEVGARKPTKLYFQSFLMENPKFIGATFVDDLLDNLTMAERFGFKGYQFNLDNYNKLSDDEKRLELLQLRKAIG